MKYVWPACGCCAKFLFPPEDHRGSIKHVKKVRWMHYCIFGQAGLEELRANAAWTLSMKNQRGLDFGRCL